ncbi:MAG: tRNA lysidine(34) synthetase TilS [Candidatus Velthaea sp.]
MSSASWRALRGAKPGRALATLVRKAVPFAAGEIVLVACSGGPDSVALASVLDRVAREDGFDLVLGHVNHGIRESALQDECIVVSVGARLGRAVKVADAGVERDDEASLRDRRYAVLGALAAAAGARAIATAHTAEDQTETVLLALFRGTGLDGLAGIPPARELPGALRLLRPLLRATHADLAAELYRSALPYALDPTNADRRYRRNALRHALAGLRAEFPQLDRAVARCAEIVRGELADGERGAARRELRARLRAHGDLRDIPFERIEAALDAGSDRRVFLKTGLELDAGDLRGSH